MKKVAVLLASYNGAHYIAEQIQSIVQQEGVIVDLVVADDGSSDNTVALLKNSYPVVPVTVNHPGTGSAARNFIKMICELNCAADFDYVALSDQDDIWLPNKLSRAISKIEEDTAMLYCSNLIKWNTATGSTSLLKKDFPQRQFDYLFEGGSAGCTYVFTKQFASRLQDFFKRGFFGSWKDLSHDWLIYFYARSNNFRVYIDEEATIKYRIHSSNVHGHLNKLSLRTIIVKSKQVLSGYHQNHVRHFIQFLGRDSEAHEIYRKFLGNYFQRNGVILKYNKSLMRDRRKLLIFVILNLLRVK